MKMNWFYGLLSPFLNERGEVGPTPGTDDPEPVVDPEKDTPKEGEDTPQGKGALPKEESFIDPASLSEELKPHWRRMHRAYTKKMEEIKSGREKIDAYDRFQSDPAYRQQIVSSMAKEMGLSIPANGQPAAGEPAPREIIEAVKSRLSPELAWMAEPLANAQYAAVRAMMGPREQAEAQKSHAERETLYGDLSDALSEKAPGWEEHEDEMLELLNFIKSESMDHRKYGSKLELLYNIATGNAHAVREATKRMGEAVRSKVASGQTTRSSVPNFDEKIKGAKSNQDAWKIAQQAAEAELERQGIKVK